MQLRIHPFFQYIILSFIITAALSIAAGYIIISYEEAEISGELISRILTIFSVFFYIIINLLFFYIYRKQKQSHDQISMTQNKIILLLSKLSELRDNGTDEHIKRTSEYVKLITRKLKKRPKYRKYISDKYIKDIVRSAPLHDIGKVSIPDSILLKPGKLTDDEFEGMKEHTVFGADVLKEEEKDLEFNSFLKLAIQISKSHHENWDGTGYPGNLKGEQIPLSARIMAVADVYDALRTKRTYREAFTHEKAVEIMKSDSGKKFDPEIIDIFLQLENDFRYLSAG